MRIMVHVIAAAVVLSTASPLPAKEAGEFISEARALEQAGKLSEAVALLERAASEHPQDADVAAYLGLYTGMSAGQATDYMEAGRLSLRSFELLDRAVGLDPGNPRGYLFRGIMGVSVPPFLGKLETGIRDLERVVELHAQSPGAVSGDELVTAYRMLATGCEKNEDPRGAREALERIIEIAPGSEQAEAAAKRLAELPDAAKPAPLPLTVREGDPETIVEIKRRLEREPGNEAILLELGRAYFGAGMFEDALEPLKRYVAVDGSSVEGYRMLALSTAMSVQEGYDERIADDTDLRTEMAFETMSYLDRAVELAPEDIELRFFRGMFGIVMPFFVGKHGQGVADLELVAAGEAPDSLKSQALYYLGVAKQREAMRYWIDVAKKYPGSEAARMVYNDTRPKITRFDPAGLEKPAVVIDFIIGFQDELPPQTAVWVEDAAGNYIETIYVSGFAGNVKGVQVTLPVWAAVSEFEHVDGVTSASIDVGHHVYTWDCTDPQGKRVERGEYVVKVEASFWPSGMYQRVEATIVIGKKESRVKVEEGDFVPYLEVTYLPR